MEFEDSETGYKKTYLAGRQSKIFLVSVIIALVLAASTTYLAIANHKLSSKNRELEARASQAGGGASEVAAVLEKVSKLLVLPESEIPTLATVTDLAKLQDKPFFAKAQLGDKVLIFTSSKKAVLYRPAENKIIEVAPINTGGEVSGASVPVATTTKTSK